MKNFRKLLTTLMLSMLFVLGSASAVFAMTISQTGQTSNSVTIGINYGTDKVVTQTLHLLMRNENYQYVDAVAPVALPVGTTSYTFNNLMPGTKYEAKMEYTWQGYSKSYTSNRSQYVVTLPGKVTGVNQVKWWYYIHKVDFGWNPQTACQFEWVAYQGKKQVAQGNAVTSNSGSFGTKNNKLYTVKVRSYLTLNGQTYYGDWSDPAYLFTQPMILDRKGVSIDGSGKLHVKWEKIDGVDGYEIYVSTKKDSGYKKVGKASKKKNSATIKKFKKKKFAKKKTYYVYVAAKKKANGKKYTSGVNYTIEYKKGSIRTLYFK